MSITIRDTTEADLPAITEIYTDAVLHGTATYELEPPTLAEMTERYKSLRENSYPYFVAEENGRVLGYAYANHFRPRRAYRFCLEDSIYLADGARGRLDGVLRRHLCGVGTDAA